MSDTDYSEFWDRTLQEPYRDYWQALGKYIDQFAAVEQAVQELLRHYAGTSDEVGRVVFSGHRIKDGTDTVNRLLDARKLPRVKARLKPIFDHLGEINTTRNNIVHWGVIHDWAEGIAGVDGKPVPSPGVIVTNKHLVQAGRAEQRYLVSVGDFHNMIADLIKIGMHCFVEMQCKEIGRPIYRQTCRPVLRSSWLYKPPQRSAPPQPNQSKSRKQTRQQKSSDGSAELTEKG